MENTNNLAIEFDREVRSILEREKEIGYNSVRFRQMLDRRNGVEVARALLKPDKELPANTFSELRARGRLDLTMEFYVMQEKYYPLFDDNERDIAAFRLRAAD